ncbi:GGDEF domain-containing protein [Bdellovibrionota bacterium FG-1]
MNREHTIEISLEEIRHLLSHLHGEVTALGASYESVLSVLKKVEGVANTDDLTGLLRRRAFFQTWQALLQKCQSLNESCGVLMIDIDHFKKVNDTHGHDAGDEVIKRVAGLLKQFESPDCVVSRLGGEEFAVALRGSDAEILGVAESIRRTAEKSDAPIQCTLSVGMSSVLVAGYDASVQLKKADEALYDAKQGGRNRVSAAA